MIKHIDIPQEKNSAQDGVRKVMYAPNNSGKFKRFKYSSSVEEFATKTAVHEYEILKKESLEKIRAGISSPIEFFMHKNRMDLPTLAAISGFFQFRVKRHLKAEIFQKLNDKILTKYADGFNISLKDLKKFKADSYE
jgi:hypothetical protein